MTKILTLLLLNSFAVSFIHAKTMKDFNQSLMIEVDKEMTKDDEQFKKPSLRAPASVDEEREYEIKGPSKIDKNIKQIGTNQW